MKSIVFFIILAFITSCNKPFAFFGCKICPGNQSRKEVKIAKKNDKKNSREAARRARKEGI